MSDSIENDDELSAGNPDSDAGDAGDTGNGEVDTPPETAGSGADDGEAAADAGHGAPSLERAVAVTEYLVKAVTDEPEAVRVTATPGDPARIDVEVAPGDVGRVIGKRGKVANSLRTIIRAAAHLDGAQVDIEFDR